MENDKLIVRANCSKCDNILFSVVVLQYLYEHTDAKRRVSRERIRYDLSEAWHNATGKNLDRKRVSRYLKSLKKAGFDIVGVKDDQEKQSGKVYLRTRTFSDFELRFLKESVINSRCIDQRTCDKLLEKLNSLGTYELIDDDRKDKRNFEKVRSLSLPGMKNMDIIKKAIKDNNKIQFYDGGFCYLSDSKEIKYIKLSNNLRRITPYFLTTIKGDLYVIGYEDYKDCLSYIQLSRMVEVNIYVDTLYKGEDKKYKIKHLDEFLLSHPYMHEGKEDKVTIKIPQNRLTDIVTVFGKDINVEVCDNAFFKIEFICNIDDIVIFAIENGHFLEVIKPQYLRKAIRKKLDDIYGLYQKTVADREYEYFDMKSVIFKNLKSETEVFERSSFSQAGSIEIISCNLNSVWFLGKCDRLEKLLIEDTPVVDLSGIRYLPLVILKLDNLEIDNLNFLQYIPSLEILEMRNLPNIKNLDFLVECKNLKKILLDGRLYDMTDKQMIEKNGTIIERKPYKDRTYHNDQNYFKLPYPENLVKSIDNKYSVNKEKEKELSSRLNDIIECLGEPDNMIISNIYKQHKTLEMVSNELGIDKEIILYRREHCERRIRGRFHTFEIYNLIFFDKNKNNL